MFCTQCGKRNSDVAQFCFACGSALVMSAEVVPAPGPTAPDPERTGTASKRCPSCGVFNPGNAAHCDCGYDFITGAARPQYAGFWIRAAASVIDGFVIGGISIAGAIAFGAAGLLTDMASEAAAAGYYIVYILALWLYYATFESSSKQATLGKRAVGILVTDTSGHRLSFGRASGRAFAKWLNALTLGIGWIVVAFSEQKRGLHDFIAGTLVIHRSDARKAGPAMVVALCALATVPVVGIIAAIAVPGLLRARMSGNEASAIGSLRAINSAQKSYANHCRGYAPTLLSLGAAGNLLISDLTAAETVTKSGYLFTVSPMSDSEPVTNAPPGCEGAVTEYFAQAVPVTPGSTGVRYFATDARGIIYQDTSARFDNATPLQ